MQSPPPKSTNSTLIATGLFFQDFQNKLCLLINHRGINSGNVAVFFNKNQVNCHFSYKICLTNSTQVCYPNSSFGSYQKTQKSRTFLGEHSFFSFVKQIIQLLNKLAEDSKTQYQFYLGGEVRQGWGQQIRYEFFEYKKLKY